jgi:glutaredoxin
MATLVLPWGAVDAQRTYKWIDKDGNVSYRDHPPPPGSGYRVEERRIDSRAGAGDSADTAAKPPVVLYSVPKCNPCDAARAHLQKRNVPFTEKNAQGDVKVQQELQQKVGALSVPAIVIGTKVLGSYAEGWLDSELDQAGYAKAGSEPVPEGEAAEPPPEDAGNQAPAR